MSYTANTTTLKKQNHSLKDQITESLKDLNEIHENLEKKSGEAKQTSQEILIHMKKDVKNIIQEFENFTKSAVHEGSEMLEKAKPFFENLIHDIKKPSSTISDEIDISALKLKLASIHAKLFLKEKADNFKQNIKEKINL